MASIRRVVILMMLLLLLLDDTFVIAGKRKKKNKTSLKNQCEVCDNFVNQFQKGMDRTSRENMAGGDVDWEERKNMVYKISETRLVEILDDSSICGKSYECGKLLEDYEETIERWWFHGHSLNSLRHWLCVDAMDSCCTDGHWGHECLPCPGGSDLPCNGHGTCKGQGLMVSDDRLFGRCSCDSEYAGDDCSSCSFGFHRKNTENSELLECVPCDSACSGCIGPGYSQCSSCAADHYKEIYDNDEGLEANNVTCLKCDPSCASCDNAGHKACKTCSDGYFEASEESGFMDILSNFGSGEASVVTCIPCVCNQHSSLCSTSGVCTSCKHDTAGDHCDLCKSGYYRTDSGDASLPCIDIDECSNSDASMCPENEVCVNIPGSYKCQCHHNVSRDENNICPTIPSQNDDEEPSSSVTPNEKVEL